MTDDWDRRCIMNILNDYYSPAVLSDEHKFSESGIYHQLPLTSDHEVLHCFPRIFSDDDVADKIGRAHTLTDSGRIALLAFFRLALLFLVLLAAVSCPILSIGNPKVANSSLFPHSHQPCFQTETKEDVYIRLKLISRRST